jgi:hypothetical protein
MQTDPTSAKIVAQFTKFDRMRLMLKGAQESVENDPISGVSQPREPPSKLAKLKSGRPQ